LTPTLSPHLVAVALRGCVFLVSGQSPDTLRISQTASFATVHLP
jgi:hypothetical protein